MTRQKVLDYLEAHATGDVEDWFQTPLRLADEDDAALVERLVGELIHRVRLDLPAIPRDDAWEELCREVGSRKMDKLIWPEAY